MIYFLLKESHSNPIIILSKKVSDKENQKHSWFREEKSNITFKNIFLSKNQDTMWCDVLFQKATHLKNNTRNINYDFMAMFLNNSTKYSLKTLKNLKNLDAKAFFLGSF